MIRPRVNKQSFLQEWPLVAFTLAIQVACGIALATTIAVVMQASAQSGSVRALAIAVFPTVAAGLLLSLGHLGRPLSAWRALSNPNSSLTLEVLLTSAFAVAAFTYSLSWFTELRSIHLFTGAITSMFGVAAVIASAAIYQIPARQTWNSAWVMLSFIGSTVAVAGVALSVCSIASPLGTVAVISGSALLLLAGTWMWLRSSRLHQPATLFRISFTGYLLLVTLAPVLLLSSPFGSTIVFASSAVAIAIIIGRLLMFALSELEPRF